MDFAKKQQLRIYRKHGHPVKDVKEIAYKFKKKGRSGIITTLS